MYTRSSTFVSMHPLSISHAVVVAIEVVVHGIMITRRSTITVLHRVHCESSNGVSKWLHSLHRGEIAIFVHLPNSRILPSRFLFHVVVLAL